MSVFSSISFLSVHVCVVRQEPEMQAIRAVAGSAASTVSPATGKTVVNQLRIDELAAKRLAAPADLANLRSGLKVVLKTNTAYCKYLDLIFFFIFSSCCCSSSSGSHKIQVHKSVQPFDISIPSSRKVLTTETFAYQACFFHGYDREQHTCTLVIEL
jgi:hypothetical protein